MVPGVVAKRVTHDVPIPTIGIGAGPDTDAQVLVWQDMVGLRTGKMPRFVKQYADMAGMLADAATAYATDVREGVFPAPRAHLLALVRAPGRRSAELSVTVAGRPRGTVRTR